MTIVDHGGLMDRVYRHQRHIYDASRKYYLLGRDPMIAGLNPPPGASVLEIGCGTGRNLVKAARRYKNASFYGIDISVRPSMSYFVPGLTLGGLRVEGSTGLVLDEGGSPIPNLYAAGRNAVGICSNSYVSGLALADGIFSGKRAGEHAASTLAAGRQS